MTPLPKTLYNIKYGIFATAQVRTMLSGTYVWWRGNQADAWYKVLGSKHNSHLPI